MADELTLLIVSDIHYACEAEKQRRNFEHKAIAGLFPRLLIKGIRHFFWMRDPFAHNPLLDRFLDAAPAADFVVANGDFGCDSAFVGVSDDACFASVQEALEKLRGKFGDRLLATIGDHELGKMSLAGGRGGLRLASWPRVCGPLALQPFWKIELGYYVLIGITSSLVALSVYEPEILAAELGPLRELQAAHLQQIRLAFAGLQPRQRVLLFCHDPTALPFLWRDDAVRARLAQVERTIIGHLHSRLLLWKSRMLAGLPPISFLGNSIRRMSAALHDARHWRPFNVMICPALAGIELLKDGGYYSVKLDPEARTPARFEFHPLPR